MPQITAAAVKALRDRTGLPMMDCKKALQEADGDEEAAIEQLRKAGAKVAQKRAGKETSEGRIAICASLDPGVGTIVELQCESAPVASSDGFTQLANDLARQLATGPGAATPEELLAQPSPSQAPKTLQEQFDELVNQIREAFRLSRIARFDGPCGGYVHHDGGTGVLVEVEGGDAELAKDVSMHITAMRPSAVSKDDLDPEAVAKEREILSEQAREEADALGQEAEAFRVAAKVASCVAVTYDDEAHTAALRVAGALFESDAARLEGKRDKTLANLDRMVEGRLREFYAQQCLLDQPYVKGQGKKDTVAKVTKAAGMKVVRFVRWEIGKE